MKYFALLFIVTVFFIGCESVESQQATNLKLKTESNSSEIIQSSKDRLEDLTEEQKQKLNYRIPPEVREVLDKAEEFTIFYDIDKDTMQLRVLMNETVPNADANVADPALKKEFLDSFYSDASSNSSGNSCFSPRQRIKAKYKTRVVEIDICYECSNFQGNSSSGAFGGTLGHQSKSSAIMDAIIEKYGKKIK